MAEERRMIIWPAYLDAKKTLKEGRRIPKDHAIEEPKIREINRAASKIGLNPQAYKGKSYPKSWWESSGVVEVDIKFSKKETLLKISNMIKSTRK